MEEKITKYKMYKSRDKWVVAGISMCGGILAAISGNGGIASANSISQINAAPNNPANQNSKIISNNSITSQSLKQQSNVINNSQNTTNNTIKDNQVNTNNISINNNSVQQSTSKAQNDNQNNTIKSTNNSTNSNLQSNLNNKDNQSINTNDISTSKTQNDNQNSNNLSKGTINKNTQNAVNSMSVNNSNTNIVNNSQNNNNSSVNNQNTQSSLENTINNQNYSSQDKNVINALLSGKQVKSDDIRAKNLLINIDKQYYDVIDNNGVLSLHKITNITTGMNHYQGLTSLQDNTIAQNQTMQVSSFQTDKAEYMPGDTVKISIVVKNNISVNQFGTYKVNVYNPLSNEITIATGSWKANANGGTDPIIIDWKTPNIDNKGYIINVQLLTTEGKIVGEYDNAVDVCSDWRKHPRYGALTNFSNSSQNSGNNVDLDVDTMAKDFHLDAAMLYDAYFRPQNPLPTNMNGSFTDWIGDQISEDLIKQTISRQHQDGMKSLLYNMINATTGFPTDNNANMNNTWQVTGSGNNRQLISPWGIYNSQGQMEHFDMLNSNEDTQRQWYYNPASKDWQNYIGNIMKETLDYFGFDGWQGDTLGNFHDTTYEDRGNMSKAFNSDSTYQDFANAMKKILGDKEFGMNAVNAGGEDGLAKSNADWQYMELWPGQYGGFTTYESLAEEITNIFNESGKSPIVPAYMYNQWRKDQTAASNTMPKNYNDNALRLQWATIMANGGSPMNIADDGLLINNEYYPGMRKNNQISMDDAAGNATTGYLRHYYDFLTAYENLLQDLSMKRNNNYIQVWNGGAVNEGQCINHDDARTNSVYAFSRSNGSTDTISLINLMGTNNINWQVNNNLDNSNKNINQQKNLWIKYYPSEQNQNITHVYMSSPDSLYQSKRIEIPFVEETDQSGHKYIEFEVPNLDVWDLIYMTSNQLSTVPTTSVTTNTNNQPSNSQNKPSSNTNTNNQKPNSNTNINNKNNSSSSTNQVKPSSGIQTGSGNSSNSQKPNSNTNNSNQNKPSSSNTNKPSNSQSPSNAQNSNKPSSNTNNSNQSSSAGNKGAGSNGVDKNNQNNGGNKQSGNNTNNSGQSKNDDSQPNNGNINSNNTTHNNQPSNSDNSNTHSSSASNSQQTGGISTSDPSMSLGREVAKFGNYVWFENTDSKGSSIEFAHLNTGKYQSLGDYDNVSDVKINKNNNIISFSYEKNGKKYYIEFNGNTSNNNEVDAESSDYESSYLADAKSSFGKSAIYVGDNTQYNANDPMLKHEKAVTIYKYGDHYEMSPASDGIVSHFNYDSKNNTVNATATGIAPAGSLPIDNIKINGNSVIVMVNNKPYTFTNNWLGNTQSNNSSNQSNNSNVNTENSSNTNNSNSLNNQKPSQSGQNSNNKNNSQSSNSQSNNGMNNSNSQNSNKNNQSNTNINNSSNQSSNVTNNSNSQSSTNKTDNSNNTNSSSSSNEGTKKDGMSIFDNNGDVKPGSITVKSAGVSETANKKAQSNDANETSNNQPSNNAELNALKNNIDNNNMNYASNLVNNIDYPNKANNSINNNRAINSADSFSPKHSSLNSQIGSASLNNKLQSNNLPQTGDSELFELSLLLLAQLGLVGIIKIKK